MNSTYLYKFLEDATITQRLSIGVTTTTAAASGYPISNLLNRNANLQWRSNVTTSGQTLDMDFGASGFIANYIVIDNHNLTSSIVVKLWGTNTSLITSGTVLTTLPLTDNTRDYFSFTNSTAYRYYILEFTGTLAPQIGNISIGEKFETSINYNIGYKYGEQHITNSQRAIDGTLHTSQLYAGFETLELAYTNISEADRVGFLKMLNSIRGTLRPFYFVDWDSTLSLFRVKNDYIPLTNKHFRIYDIELQLEEVSTNTITTRLDLVSIDLTTQSDLELLTQNENDLTT